MSESILKYETIVYNIINDYLSNNKTLELEHVIPYVSSRLSKASINLNNDGVLSIVQSLLEKNLIVEGSKLTKSDILNNLKRLRIYNFILKNPCTYYYKIVKDLNISSHVVIWHLNMLLDFNFINKQVLDFHEVYFDSKMDFEKVKLFYFISNEKCRKILDYLKTNKSGSTKTQISTDLGMHINTIKKYIETLENLSLLIKKKISNKIIYTLNEQFYAGIIAKDNKARVETYAKDAKLERKKNHSK